MHSARRVRSEVENKRKAQMPEWRSAMWTIRAAIASIPSRLMGRAIAGPSAGGEMRGELREREGVNALQASWRGVNGYLSGGGPRRS
jgi:hypothetical protein